MNQSIRYVVASACAAMGPGCLLSAESVAPLSAQRTTVSSDTSTTTEGTVEIEFGYQQRRDDAWQTPANLKFGLSGATELFFSISPAVHLEVPGQSVEGPGDLTVGLRQRFTEASPDPADWSPSLGWQWTVKAPTADKDEGLGTGEWDASLSGIATQPWGGGIATLFAGVTRVGDPQGAANWDQHIALAYALPMRDRIGSFVEVAGLYFDQTDTSEHYATLGVTYHAEKSLVWDLGVRVGLDDDALPDLFFVGLTQNLGHIWGD